ncbi:MAG TPA: hypothetical protein VNT81_17430 [Vicinamibacterales bacterium]|nr:hypothetical protein [Vicinamibacterales bacterium]
MIVCTAEDRPHALVGLKLLALSLERHCPGVELHAFSPLFPRAFEQWARTHRSLKLCATRAGWPSSWNTKPTILLDRLDAGFDDVVWIDADVVLTRDFRAAWGALSQDTMVVAGEPASPIGGDGSALRTEAFGFTVGRAFPVAINSAVVRITRTHQPLVAAWRELLQEPAYVLAQAQPVAQRPRHLVSDQDGLAALIGSTRFANVPVKMLQPPLDILHAAWGAYANYPLRHRLRHALTGLPPLVHALGQPKPWDPASAARLSAGLSPYCAVAAAYEEELGEPAPWLHPASAIGRASHAIALGNPALRDLPATLAVAARQWGRRQP